MVSEWIVKGKTTPCAESKEEGLEKTESKKQLWLEFQQWYRPCLSLTHEPYSHFHRPNACHRISHSHLPSKSHSWQTNSNEPPPPPNGTALMFGKTHNFINMLVLLVPATNFQFISPKRAKARVIFIFTMPNGLLSLLLLLFQDRWINMNFRTRVHDKLALCQQWTWQNWGPFASCPGTFFPLKTINYCVEKRRFFLILFAWEKIQWTSNAMRYQHITYVCCSQYMIAN